MDFFSINQSSDSDYNESSSEEQDEEVLDEEEFKRRKDQYTNEIIDLERQFESIKNQLFRERIQQAEKKLKEVKAETSEDYLQPLNELQENMNIRIEVAGILRELRLKNVNCQHSAEKKAAEQNFEMQKHMLKEQLRLELEDKLRRLEEDRHSSGSDSFTECLPNLKRKKRYSNQIDNFLPDRRKKPVTLNGPYIVYMLNEAEILEDFNLIRKAQSQSFLNH